LVHLLVGSSVSEILRTLWINYKCVIRAVCTHFKFGKQIGHCMHQAQLTNDRQGLYIKGTWARLHDLILFS